jgi:DNA-binding transcriptional LysR family regulator
LSRQIKQLEAALGICLFDRAPRRLRLTIEGRELAGRLPALFAQIDQAVQGTNAGGTTQLRIGDGGTLTTEVIAPALRRLRQTWPQLDRSEAKAEGTCDGVGVVIVSGDLPVVANGCPDPRCPLDRNVRIND